MVSLVRSRLCRVEGLNVRHWDALKMALDTLGPTIKPVHRLLALGNASSFFSPFQEFSGGSSFNKSISRVGRDGIGERLVRHGYELSQAFSPGEVDRPRLDHFPVQRERVVEPPCLDHSLKGNTVRLPPIARALDI